MENKKVKVANREPMNYQQLCPIWDRLQKEKARTQIRKVDRAKTTLTDREKLNKFAQVGGVIYCGNVYFTYDYNMGMGLLITPSQKILGATIGDFFNEVGV